MVEGPIVKTTREKMVIAIKAMKSGKTDGLSAICAKMIFASGVAGTSVMMEFFQRVLDGKGMSDEWQTNVLVPIFKEKGDVRSCNAYRE